MKKVLAILGGIILIALMAWIIFRFLKSSHSTNATSTSLSISSKEQWDLGSVDNVATDNPSGSLAINSRTSAFDMTSIPSENIATAGSASTGKDNATDGNTDTYWVFQSNIMDDWAELVIDIGAEINVSQINAYTLCPVMEYDCQLYSSTDGVTYSSVATLNGSLINANVYSGSMNVRYFKVKSISQFYEGFESWAQIKELIVVSSGIATHTTAPTQIDGGANFWQWETFTDSKTTPANTSVTYRYRTSTNGSDWTAWVANIGSVTSRTGDDSNNPTKYRYLQIEATLSNTDGASTPTIDSYTIGYHTNQKPNAPTAMTAVVN